MIRSMTRRPPFGPVLFSGIALMLFAQVQVSHAGLMDKIKKKAEDKAKQTAEGVVDEKTGEVPGEATGEATTTATIDATSEGGDAKPPGNEKVSEVSTKFDYVPGDKVILFDDFTQDELGEFPAQWKLASGTFEVAEKSGERWLRCTSADGRVQMKLPEVETLPEFWTLEFDFYATEPMSGALMVYGLAKDGNSAWEATFPQGRDMFFRSGEVSSSTPLEVGNIPGRHHVMFMARGKALKAYVDRERLVNVPEVSSRFGPASVLQIRLWASTKPMITNVRYAEGCRPPKDLLAEGKLVTYGIHFDSGSDVVLPDSAPVMRQIAAYMDANTNVKLKITGHTDNVGSAPSNLDLSKRRAASVARVLAEQFKIAPERFATDGLGDTEKVADNSTPAGRAMNRRVEFAKI
jgi:outer membrane protein OmpA-like peptidoglycan-associated protein